MRAMGLRVSEGDERWLEFYFKSRAAGCEVIIPWALDMLRDAIRELRAKFQLADIWRVIKAYEGAAIKARDISPALLRARVADYLERTCGGVAPYEALVEELGKLSQVQAAAMIMIASGYWRGKARLLELDAYCRNPSCEDSGKEAWDGYDAAY